MKFSLNSVNKSIQIMLFLLFTINTAAALWTPLFSVFIISHIVGATLATLGLTSVLYSVTKSLLQIPIARSLDQRAGERDDFFFIFIGILLSSICSFSFIFMTHIWQLGAIQILWGIADACTMAAYYAIFSHHIDKKGAAFEWSLFSVGGMTVSTAIGGLIGGLVAEYYGFSVIFIAAGTLNVAALFLLGPLYPYMKAMRVKHVGALVEEGGAVK